MQNTPAYPKWVGLIRTVGMLALWAAVTAIIHFFGDPANLAGWVSPTISTIIVAAMGVLESSIQSKGNGALFGAAKNA